MAMYKVRINSSTEFQMPSALTETEDFAHDLWTGQPHFISLAASHEICINWDNVVTLEVVRMAGYDKESECT